MSCIAWYQDDVMKAREHDDK